MATRFFSQEQMERLRSYPDIGREELVRFFTLTGRDLAFVDNQGPGSCGGKTQKVDHLLTSRMRGDLDGLLVGDPLVGMTRLAWLTTPAVEASAAAVRLAVDKLLFLRGMDAHELDVSMLPRERRRFLANLGRRSTVQGLMRREERRFPILLALVAQSAVDQLDEVIALFDRAVSAREPRPRPTRALAERAKKGEARQLLMDVILPVLVDTGIPDEDVGAILRGGMGMGKLREVASVVWKPLPRDHGRLSALEASYTYLRKFTLKGARRKSVADKAAVVQVPDSRSGQQVHRTVR